MPPKFTCDICDRGFDTSYQLLRHNDSDGHKAALRVSLLPELPKPSATRCNICDVQATKMKQHEGSSGHKVLIEVFERARAKRLRERPLRLRGIVNEQNACFAIAVLQLLAASRLHFSDPLESLLSELQVCDVERQPASIERFLQTETPQFRIPDPLTGDFPQHDAHEFLLHLLEERTGCVTYETLNAVTVHYNHYIECANCARVVAKECVQTVLDLNFHDIHANSRTSVCLDELVENFKAASRVEFRCEDHVSDDRELVEAGCNQVSFSKQRREFSEMPHFLTLGFMRANLFGTKTFFNEVLLPEVTHILRNEERQRW